MTPEQIKQLAPRHYELLDALNSTHTTFWMSSFGMALLATPQVRPVLDEVNVICGVYNVEAKTMSGSGEQFTESIYVLSKSISRQLITEGFELIKGYSIEIGKQSVFENQSWYHFSRLIRNAYNHNHKLVFNKKDIRLLPLKWANPSTPNEICVIDKDMDGLPVDVVNREFESNRKYFQFTYENALGLFYQMRIFAEGFK